MRLWTGLLVAALLVSNCGDGTRPFERSVWKRHMEAEKTGAALEGMARTLVRDRTLIGKSREEVQALLGTDDVESDIRRSTEKECIWLVNDLKALLSVTELVVRFGPDDRVVDAEVVTKST
jgi:hypothetical protein